MPDPTIPPVVAPTDGTAPAVNPAQSPAPAAPLVNPAQATIDPALYTQAEQRIRDLMSRADKAIHDRDQAITAQVRMQNELTQYQQSAQEHLNMAANTAQAALDRQKALELENERLKAEHMRAQMLLQKPHMAAYLPYLPLTTNADELRQSVETLEQIRQRDQEQLRAQLLNTTPNATTLPSNPFPFTGIPFPGTTPPVATLPATPPPQQILSAAPAAMNPMGAIGDPLQAIQDLYAKARASGRPEDMHAAHAQATRLANAAVQQEVQQARR